MSRVMNACIISFAPDAYGTVRLAEVLTQRGHRVVITSPVESSVILKEGRRTVTSAGQLLRNIDVVFPRAVTYFHQGRQFSRSMEIAMAIAMCQDGAVAVNDPWKKLLANDKVLASVTLAAGGVQIAPTAFAASGGAMDAVHDSIAGPYVAKLTEGTWGAGVMQVDSYASLTTVAEAFFCVGQPLMVQPNLHSGSARHIRALVLGEKVLAAYEMIPRTGDFRGNIASGATARPIAPPDSLCRASVDSAVALGLVFAGVDLIEADGEAFVVDVNPAPGFEVEDGIPGIDVANALVDHVSKLV